MNSLTTIEKDGNVYAHFFRSDVSIPGAAQFVTEEKDPMQVGIFERDADYQVVAHRHLPRKLDLDHIGEFLLIQNGSALVRVFDEEWNVLCEQTVSKNDCVIFLRGGHELTMLEPTRILEVKQGPYPTTAEEKTFRPHS